MTPSAVRGGTLPRPVRGARARLLPILLLGAIVCGLAGCLTFEGTLKPDGSGTFEVTYKMQPKATPDGEKARYSSPHVIVDSFSNVTGKESMVVLKGHFADVTKLSTAQAFKDVTVTRTTEGPEEHLVVKVTNPTQKTLKDVTSPGPKFVFHLPGTVKAANYDATVSGDTATWSFTLADWAGRPATELDVRYTPAVAGATNAAAKEAVAEPAKSAPAPAKKKKH